MGVRKATKNDVTAIVALLSDDPLGEKREDFRDPLPKNYFDAFDQIDAEPNQELVVFEDGKDGIIGTLQLSFIPYLTYQGGTRAQIEAVRVHKNHRGKGIGKQLFEWAIGQAKHKGAHVVQLTTDKQRPQARKFYESLGFKASHEGMKLHL